MSTSVDLDCQACFFTEEIQDEPSDGVLTPKPDADP
jgi:hypothetical protein